MGGHRVPERGPNDDGYVEGGFDESQRAEIMETTRGGPHDDTVQTDLRPDLEESDSNIADDIEMRDNVVGEEDIVDQDRDDRAEDEIQADFDNPDIDAETLDGELDDEQSNALDR